MKIAIVNDMLIAVEALRRVLSTSTEYEIIWVAHNGAQAVEQCKTHIPDLILMDLIMPVMDGVEATAQIMKNTPCPIMIVTNSVEGNADKVFRAMGAGAIDAINTPVPDSDSPSELNHYLLAKLKSITPLILPKILKTFSTTDQTKIKRISTDKISLVAIGASSGGPEALMKILKILPESFSVPVIIVQHVDEQFAPELASWLGTGTNLNVKLADENEKMKKGNVYIAGKNKHLIINKQMSLSYTDEPKELAYIPSVNVFFSSIVSNWPLKILGVVLTGMGDDGAEGLLRLRNRGDYTVTQNKDSCAVYGMPKSAVKLDAAMEVLPINKIADRIMQIVK